MKLVNYIKQKVKDYLAKRKFKKRLKELAKRDPFIYR